MQVSAACYIHTIKAKEPFLKFSGHIFSPLAKSEKTLRESCLLPLGFSDEWCLD